MIIPDINLLVYAYNRAAVHHAKARAWWERVLNGETPVGIPWIVSAGFIRLMTHPRVLVDPMPVADAVAAVRTWHASDVALAVNPGERFGAIFLGYLERLGIGGNLTTDAQIAALAAENQAVLYTNDRDFSRFDGLRLRNPLV